LKCRIQGLKIERPVPDDLDSAYRVFEESIALAFEEEGISHDAPAEIEYKQQLIRSSVLEDTYDFVFFVAKLGDAVIGTISYGPCGDDIRKCLGEELEDLGEVGSIYVLPGFQGQGVASALIAAMLEYLQSLGVKRFYLDCGLKSAQQKWLRKFGQPYKTAKDYWGEGSDHLIWLCAVEASAPAELGDRGLEENSASTRPQLSDSGGSR